MRGPDRGSDYRRSQLVETMRSHTLSGDEIARRVRCEPRGADGRRQPRWRAGDSARRHSARERFADD